MQYSVLFLTLIAAAYSCDDVWTQACSGLSCPSAPTIQVSGNSFSSSDFNLISFGSVTINSGDVEGRVAVRNDFNATQQGVSIGYSLPSSQTLPYSLVAGRNVNWVNGELYPANAGLYVGGIFSGAATLKAQVSGNNCGVAGCLNSQFDSLASYYSGVSSTLAAVADNAVASVQYQELTVTCSGSASINFVSVDVAVWNQMTTFKSSGCNSNSVVIFNIKGSDAVKFMGNSFADTVALFNVISSTSVEIDTFVYGSLLAPLATVNQVSGTVAGNVVAGDVTVLVQVNMPVCPNATTPSTTAAAPAPAPATTASVPVPPAASTGSTGVPDSSSTSTSGVPSTSTTGNNGGNVDCTFLDNQASCASVNADFSGSNYNFNFGDYDVIVFGDLSANSGDIEGRSFVYGNVDFSNGQFSLGLKASGSEYTLVAGGLNFASGSITGRAFVAGSVSDNTAGYLRGSISGPCSNSGCLDTIKNNGQSCYNAVSSSFGTKNNANLALSGSKATLTCNSASDSVYYFNVDSTSMNAASYGSSVNCNADATYVVNIVGSDDITFSGAAFPTYNVVYNVEGSRTVTIATSVHGSVLAPQSRVVMNSGLIVGKLVAQSAQIVQVNVPNCVSGSTGANSGANSGNQGSDNGNGNTSAGSFATPSVLVTLIALFIAKMF